MSGFHLLLIAKHLDLREHLLPLGIDRFEGIGQPLGCQVLARRPNDFGMCKLIAEHLVAVWMSTEGRMTEYLPCHTLGTIRIAIRDRLILMLVTNAPVFLGH